MIKKLVFILCYIYFVSFCYTQKIISKIVDKYTGKPISYVNIGVINTNIGTVSDENGNFQLSLENARNSDTLMISIISYKNVIFNIGILRETDFPSEIKIEEHIFELKEIVIDSKKNKPYTLGLKAKYCYPIPFYKKVSSKIPFPQKNYFHEIGTHFKNTKSFTLDSIQLNFASCKLQNIRFRINVYLNKNSEIKNILDEPIYISLTKKQALNFPIIDLSKYRIQLKDNFIITIENYTKMDNNSVYLLANFKSKGREFPTYYRENSQSKLEKLTIKKSKDFGLSLIAYLH